MTVYYDRAQVQEGAFPSMLAIGDSWFWYPKVSNLLAEVSALVKPGYSNIMALGYLGARLEEYMNGKYARALARELRPQFAQYYSAVLVSGGGNDAVDWGLCLKGNCSNETTAAGCVDEDALAVRMRDLGGWLLALLNEIHLAFANLRRPDVFVHCYDYAPPNGRGFEAPLFGVTLNGPWLKPAMDHVHVPQDDVLRQDIVRLLIAHSLQAGSGSSSPRQSLTALRPLG